jgi:hypothetical protein
MQCITASGCLLMSIAHHLLALKELKMAVYGDVLSVLKKPWAYSDNYR